MWLPMEDGCEIDRQTAPSSRRTIRHSAGWLVLLFAAGTSCAKRTMDTAPMGSEREGSAGAGSGSEDAITVTGNRLPRQLTWNVWAEQTAWRPVPTLEPGRAYTLVVDLAGIAYAGLLAGVGSPATSAVLHDALEEAAQADAPPLDLDILVLPDPNAFGMANNQWVRLSVDVSKMDRDLHNGPRLSPTIDVMGRLASGTAEFSYGLTRLPLALTTTQRTGSAPIAFAVWHAMTPLDQFVVSLCVSGSAGECAGGVTATSAPTALDWLYALANPGHPGHEAVAGLQFLRRERGVLGVFRRADDPREVVHWRLGEEDALRATLGRHLESFSDAFTEAAMRPLGDRIAGVLFRDVVDGKVPPALRRFLAAPPPGKRPALVVRMVQNTDEAPLPIPLTLAAERGSQARFLGERYEIEMPLERVPSHAPSECVRRWVMVLPPDAGSGPTSPELDAVLDALRSGPSCCLTLGQCTPVRGPGGAVQQKRCDPTDPASYFRDLQPFREWISDPAGFDPPSVVALLSHHDRMQFRFLDQRSALDEQDLERRFDEPSLAILAGCNTGSPDGARLLRRFNQIGFSAIIATSTEIRPMLAADFFDCFMGEVASPANQDATLDVVFSRARSCLAHRSNPDDRSRPYGAQSLKFFLAGNGNFRLCPPGAPVRAADPRSPRIP